MSVEMKTIREPSGDQSGSIAPSSVGASWRRLLAVRVDDEEEGLGASGAPGTAMLCRAKTSIVPSGDHRGRIVGALVGIR